MGSSATFDGPGMIHSGILSTPRGRLWLIVAVSSLVTFMLWVAFFQLASAAQKKAEVSFTSDSESHPDYQTLRAEIEKMNKLTGSMLAAAEKKVQADRTGK